MKFDKKQYLEENYGRNVLPLSVFDNSTRPGGVPMEDLLFYKKGTSITKLQESLVKTIDHYNLFSSRLIMIDNNKFALQYCTDGAVIDVLPPLPVCSDHVKVEDIKKLMMHVKTLPGEPLFAVTGIPIEDGVIGAISCSHAVADGISLMLFLYAWGCIIEGKSFLPPSPQRLFKGEPVVFETMDKQFTPPLSALSAEIQNRVQRNMNMKTFSKKEYFSDEFLEDMKDKALLENGQYALSNNQMINAYLLKKYHHQILPDAGTIRVRVPIDLRDVHPDIDATYIGNAFFMSFTEYTKEDINNMSIYEIAYRLKKSIQKMRRKDYIKNIAYLSAYGVELKEDVFKDYPPYNPETDILSTNMAHFADLDSLGLGSKVGSLLNIDTVVQTCFTMIKEESNRMFAQVTGMYPLT